MQNMGPYSLPHTGRNPKGNPPFGGASRSFHSGRHLADIVKWPFSEMNFNSRMILIVLFNVLTISMLLFLVLFQLISIVFML